MKEQKLSSMTAKKLVAETPVTAVVISINFLSHLSYSEISNVPIFPL